MLVIKIHDSAHFDAQNHRFGWHRLVRFGHLGCGECEPEIVFDIRKANRSFDFGEYLVDKTCELLVLSCAEGGS